MTRSHLPLWRSNPEGNLCCSHVLLGRLASFIISDGELLVDRLLPCEGITVALEVSLVFFIKALHRVEIIRSGHVPEIVIGLWPNVNGSAQTLTRRASLP